MIAENPDTVGWIRIADTNIDYPIVQAEDNSKYLHTDSNGIVRRTQFESQEAFDGWVRDRLAPCRFADIPECSVDSMYVLVTCSYEENDARTLLFAVEADEDGEFAEATGRNELKNH